MKVIVSRIAWVLYLALCFSLLFIAPAQAYLDPGSGSLIFQVIVGGAMAAGLALKVFWRRIVSMFSRRRSDDEA